MRVRFKNNLWFNLTETEGWVGEEFEILNIWVHNEILCSMFFSLHIDYSFLVLTPLSTSISNRR
jgi:hypothetical protein